MLQISVDAPLLKNFSSHELMKFFNILVVNMKKHYL